MSNLAKVIFGAVLLILVSLFLFTHFVPSTTSPVQQSQSQGLMIAPMVMDNASTTYTDIEMSYPQSSATQYPEIFNFVQSTKNDFVQNYGSPSASDIAQMNVEQNFPYQLIMTTKVATSSQTVSYIISTYEFTGGANGETNEYSFTYDATGKLVTLDDVFTGNYLPVLSQLAQTYFTNSLGDYSEPDMIDSGTMATSTNFSAWFLTDSTVTFIFQQYQVGPGVLGVEEFPIDKSQISDILNPKFMLQ